VADGTAHPDTRPAVPAATVLVVEDELINRLALVKGVQRLGHHVLQAADGAQALDLLADEHVDMVLLDLLMPGVDGFEVLERMAGDPALHTVPVLVISALEASGDVARAIELGAIDCLPKPADPVLLRVRLRVALEQARLRRMEQEFLRQELVLRRQERLATLGRLSAGLGHELNNPAAAALSASRQLERGQLQVEQALTALLARPDGLTLVTAVDRLLVDLDPPAGDAETSRRSETVEEVLDVAGITAPWDLAPELAELGLRPDALTAALEEMGQGAEPALAWLRARARVRRLVDHIIRSVSRMAELTSALRGYSHLDRAPRQDVDVREGLDDTVTILGHKVPPQVRIVRAYAAELPRIEAFGGELNQVWTNLVDNALHAVGREGTVVLRAFAKVDQAGAAEGVVVEVEDDGPGVPPELQGEVFDPFVTTKPPGQGTGLGLNIVHQIVVGDHGGQVSLDSRPGRTVFRVELPPTPTGGAHDGD
jgi:signal transduction histidine kinase